MNNVFSQLESELKKIKKDEWYSKASLREMRLYSKSFQENGALLLKKEAGGEVYLLGASVIHYYNEKLNLGLDDSIEINELSFAIGSPLVNLFARENPETCFSPYSKIPEKNKRKNLYVKGEFLHLFSNISNNETEMPGKSEGELVRLLLPLKNPDSTDLISKSKPWTHTEKENLRKVYFFSKSDDLAEKFSRTKEDIENQANALELKKLDLNSEYTISNALKISGIQYSEIQQALFRGDLETRIFKCRKDESEIVSGAILIKGKSLIEFFENKDKKPLKHMQTRAEKYNAHAAQAEGIKGIMDPMEYLKSYISSFPGFKNSKDEETKLLKRKGRNFLARNDIIEGYLPAAVWRARKYLKKAKDSLDFADLSHEGILGIIRGVDKYKINKSKEANRNERYTFLTYAGYWICKQIISAVHDSGTLRMPEHGYEKLKKIEQATNYFIEKFNHSPTIDEISKKTKINKKVVKGLVAWVNARMISASPDNFKSLKRSHADSLESAVLETERKEIIAEEIKKKIYDKRTSNVLVWKFGLNGQPKMPLKKIGDALEICGDRVRDLKKEGLEALRASEALKILWQ